MHSLFRGFDAFSNQIEPKRPSLDRLAEQGVQLNRFYTTPICSPTRAALMTGRDPMRLGVAYGVIMPWDNIGVNPAEHFMPESFGAAGYQTAMEARRGARQQIVDRRRAAAPHATASSSVLLSN